MFNTTPPPIYDYKYISLGYRCSSAGILKEMGFKTESYPFDWCVSRLWVIHDCIQNNFTEFLRVSNYKKVNTFTFQHFQTTLPTDYICDENAVTNDYYNPIAGGCYTPINTYQFQLLMNHHNIIDNTEDFEYYVRCVERLRNILYNKTIPKMFVHITPLYTMDDFNRYHTDIISKCVKFHDFLENIPAVAGENDGGFYIKGIYFIMVKDIENKPSIQLYEPVGEETNENGGNKYQNTRRIYILRTNRDFIDAGETFMGDYWREVDAIKNNILRFASF